jgi:5-methyltetrahydrofolate--homocysteine methyltransferase
VHDIGKNLVDIILTNNGYEVHNIGIKAPLQAFVDKAKEVEADAVGMSGLLVKSTLIMRENLEEMNSLGLAETPVILGGAALTRTYVERDLRAVYDGRLFYGKDAFEGLHTMDALMEGKRTGSLDPEFGRAPGGRDLPARREREEADDAEPITTRSDVAADVPVFAPPFVGARVAKGIALEEIATYINETALFRNQWQFRPEKRRSAGLAGRPGGRSEVDPTEEKVAETDDDFRVRLRPTLREELSKAQADGTLVPAVVWGYFPVNSEGNELVVWTDTDRRTERLRFNFPRQRTDRHLCIADFFRPVESGDPDYAAFHVATMGSLATERERELFAADRYQEYLLVHGLSVEMTEALAEYWHRRIREEWGFADEDGPTVQGLFRQQYRGSRYSWGYPACPNLEEQAKIDELLDLSRIGVHLTEEFQLDPEQTTSAIIVPHPEAKYFIT